MSWRQIGSGKTPSKYTGSFERVRLVRAWIAVFYAMVGLAYVFLKLLDSAL